MSPKGADAAAATEEGRDLTSSGLLARNSVFNLLGQGFPLLVALVSLPFLTRGLGPDRFGLLALAWTFIGYFTVFDFGLSRSLTQMIAERLGQNRDDETGGIAWTGLLIMVTLGAVGAGIILRLGPLIIDGILAVPRPLRSESLRTLSLLAVCLPAVIGTIGLRGILEAYQRFDLVNAVRAPMGALTFLGPLAALPFTRRLDVIVGIVVLARIVGLSVHALLCVRVAPTLMKPRWVARESLGSLFRLGGWITVSNLVSPLLVYADRFFIGALLSLSAVAYYATPHEVMTRVLVLPVAVAGVFFPAFAAGHVADRARIVRLFESSLRGILLVLVPVLLLCLVFAETGLALWAGEEYGRNGAAVARWLAVGLLFNGIAQVPFALVQGVGRPDISARFHLLEVPLYLGALAWGLTRFGVAGAAFVWSVRAMLDAFLLFGAAAYLIPGTRRGASVGLAWAVGSALGFGVVLALKPVLGQLRILAASLALFAFAARSWLVPRGAGAKMVRALFRPGAVAGVSLSAWVLVNPGSARAQEGLPVSGEARVVVPASVSVNGETEDYVRLLGLAGAAPVVPWSIRGMSPLEVRRAASGAPGHPWIGRLDFQESGPDGLQALLLPARWWNGYNSSFPFGGQDGPVWFGKGVTNAARLGAFAEWGPLSVRFEPTVFWARNEAFDLLDNGQEGDLSFADGRNPRYIDRPQRFGNGTYSRWDLGESSVRLDLPWFAMGVSAAAQHWGPARHFPLILGSNAGGFVHAFAGTGRPLDLWVGSLQLRAVWGRLEESAYSPSFQSQEHRFMAGTIAVFSPRGLPGLELGATRFFHLPWRKGGPDRDDILKPLEGLLKGSLSEEAQQGESPRDPRENQLASAFARWVFPGSGLEVYGEFAREDHSWDLRDLLMEPDHKDAWTFGIGKAWFHSEEEWWLLRGEILNARRSHIDEVRDQRPFYWHHAVNQGHTHRGQILASPAAYGGSGGLLELLRYSPSGRWRFWWERAQRNEGRNPDGKWVVDAQHSLGTSVLWFRGPLEVFGGAVVTWNLNRDLENDTWNVRLDLGASYLFNRW